MGNGASEENTPNTGSHDSESEGVWAIVVKRIAEIIEGLGHMKVVIKTDQGAGLVEAEKRVRDRLHQTAESITAESSDMGLGHVVLQSSPIGEPQSNGAAENAIQRMQGQLRAVQFDVEASTGARINSAHPLWPWLVEFAAQTLLFWRINSADGLASIQRIVGRSGMTAKPKFAEQTLYRVAKTARQDKANARWQKGIWLGSIQSSDENLFGTPRGVIKCRSVAPLPEDQRADVGAIDAVRGSAWKPWARHPISRVRTHIAEDGEGRT